MQSCNISDNQGLFYLPSFVYSGYWLLHSMMHAQILAYLHFLVGMIVHDHVLEQTIKGKVCEIFCLKEYLKPLDERVGIPTLRTHPSGLLTLLLNFQINVKVLPMPCSTLGGAYLHNPPVHW